MKREDIIFKIIGFFLLFLVFANYIFQVSQYGHWYKILWYCKIAIILAAIGFLFKKRILINMVLISSINHSIYFNAFSFDSGLFLWYL